MRADGTVAVGASITEMKRRDKRELQERICHLVVQGKPLRKIAQRVGLSVAQLSGMLADRAFLQRYDAARMVYYRLIADELVSIIDSATAATLDIAVERVKVRQWILERALRATWGRADTLTVQGNPDMPVTLQALTGPERAERLRELLQIASDRLANPQPKLIVEEAAPEMEDEHDLWE